jgi:hypothetical protein
VASICAPKFEAIKKKGKFKNAVIPMAAIIEGKKYELVCRNESRYRRGDGLRRVDRGRHGSRVAKEESAAS